MMRFDRPPSPPRRSRTRRPETCRGLRDERGASLVEMALVLPLLLVLALGAAEFGFAFVDWQAVSGATREGARVGSAAGDSPLADAAILNSVGEALSDVPHSQVLAAWIFTHRELAKVTV